MIPTRYPEYLIAAMIIILAPGPSVLFVIARAIAWGRATAVLTVLGNVSGSFVLSSLVALGIGPILQKYHIAYVAVQWGGGLYLIHLGIDAIRKRAVHASDMTNQGPVGPTPLSSIRDAEEITQEVFLTIYHKLKHFRFESSFKTWVYRLTTNHALNYVKKEARRKSKMTVFDDQTEQ